MAINIKRFFKVFTLLFILILGMTGLSSCTKTRAEHFKIEVICKTVDGQINTKDTYILEKNTYFTLPEAKTYTDYAFLGWFLDEGFNEQASNFKLKENVQIYGKYAKVSPKDDSESADDTTEESENSNDSNTKDNNE